MSHYQATYGNSTPNRKKASFIPGSSRVTKYAIPNQTDSEYADPQNSTAYRSRYENNYSDSTNYNDTSVYTSPSIRSRQQTSDSNSNISTTTANNTNNSSNNILYDSDDNFESTTTKTTTTSTTTNNSSHTQNNSNRYKQPISIPSKQQQNQNQQQSHQDQSILYKYTIAPFLYLVQIIGLPFATLDVFILSIFRGPIDMDYQTKGKVVNKCRIISWVTIVSLLSLFVVYLALFRPVNNSSAIYHPNIDEHINKLIDANNVKLLSIISDLFSQKLTEAMDMNNKKMIDVIIQTVDKFKQSEFIQLKDAVSSMQEDMKLLSTSKISLEIQEMLVLFKQESEKVYDTYILKLTELANTKAEHLNTVTQSLSENLIGTKITQTNELIEQIKEKFNQYDKSYEAQAETKTSELISKLENSQDKLLLSIHEISMKANKIQQWIEQSPEIKALESSLITIDEINALIAQKLEIYSADLTGKVDYAMASGGGKINYKTVHHPVSDTYPEISIPALLRITTWIRPAPRPNSPEIILEPKGGYLGDCWAFKGENGSISIQLAQPIIVKSITLEHPNPSISYHFESSLKDFTVFGLKNETDVGTELGTFQFKKDSSHIQNFSINNDEEYSIVVLKVLSNFGYDYTCVYRTRVHGEPTSPYRDPVSFF